LAINTSHYLNESILDMTCQKKKVAWWKRPFLAFTRNAGIYAYEIDGKCAFPCYFSSGCLSVRQIVVLIKGHPLVLDGGQFGMDEVVQKDEGGFWRVVLIDAYTTNPFEVLDKLYTAFHELKAA
jgi:hypothetical protein